MVHSTARGNQAWMIGLIGMASLGLELSLLPAGTSIWRSLLPTCGVLGLGLFLSRLLPKQPPLGLRGTILLWMFVLLPWFLEPIDREWRGIGLPNEVLGILALRNAGIALAVTPGRPRWWQLAGITSVFLLLFAMCLGSRPGLLVVLGLYAVTGVFALGWRYWSSLGTFAPLTRLERPRTGRLALPRRYPWLIGLLALVLFAGSAACWAFAPNQLLAPLGEWLPTSGGTGEFDPFSRGGVNDGDAEAAGNNPTSTGFVETDLFLDSPLPSLYDMFSDLLGEPFRPQDQQRSVALSARSETRDPEQAARNRRPDRAMSTARQRPAQPRRPRDQTARAIFEVQGRTPVHIRVAAYDQFDGISWQEGTFLVCDCLPRPDPPGDWLRILRQMPVDYLSDVEAHQFKIVEPKGTLVPTPTLLHRFYIRYVNKPDFFRWAQPEIVRMIRDLPDGITIHTEAACLDPQRLDQLSFRPNSQRLGPHHQLPKPAHTAELATLAQAWTKHVPTGWPQIEAIRKRLQTTYQFDNAYTVPEECTNTVAHFLLRSRRGPDYLFASSAAVLLRHLGYSARLVSGFYAAPEDYDPATDHTPVTRDDLHFWAEVQLPGGIWVPVESTPGYAVRKPPLSFWERLLSGLRVLARSALHHALVLGICVVLLGVGVVWRRDLWDALHVCYWNWNHAQERERIRAAMRLLEQRSRWAGRARPDGMTPRAWLDQLRVHSPPDTQQMLGQFSEMLTWASYAPGGIDPSAGTSQAICAATLRAWPWRRFCQLPPLTLSCAS